MKAPVGQVRRSQAISPYGIGALVDLPYVSGIVLGLDYWRPRPEDAVDEPRLLAAIKKMQPTVDRIMAPPLIQEDSTGRMTDIVGIPVAPFPRWLVCPPCRLLARYDSGLFEAIKNDYRPEEFKYVHRHCPKQGQTADRNKRPAIPARFLAACEHGHLNDFPWRAFAHGGPTDCSQELRLLGYGLVFEAADIEVSCGCGAKRRMSEAFGQGSMFQTLFPQCDGHHPHRNLTAGVSEPCEGNPRTILLGASNSWFPITLSAISVPSPGTDLELKLGEFWSEFEPMEDISDLRYVFRKRLFSWLDGHNEEAVWAAIQSVRDGRSADTATSIKDPEWTVFSSPAAVRHPWLRTSIVSPPQGFEDALEKVVLVERHREVRALIGFSRIDSPGEMSELDSLPSDRRAPLGRKEPEWVPGVELRGEGVFIQFRESVMQAWETRSDVRERVALLDRAHKAWCEKRPWLTPPPPGRPSRYYMLHTLAHMLIREMSIRCGYATASLRERLYASVGSDGEGNMAGILVVTATPDSEGTLGGLVGLGHPNELGPLLRLALERASLCSSDPHCVMHDPIHDSKLHGAACHSCSFLPETSCETGNRYLDRVLVVPTLAGKDAAFFGEAHLG